MGCFGFLLYTYSNAQVNFYADVSASVVGVNEFFTYRMVFENAPGIQSITPPSLKNFTVVRGPDQQSGVRWTNGQSKQFISLVFTLKPKRTGSFKIGSAHTIIAGKKLTSNAFTVTVKNQTQAINQTNPFPNYDPFEQQAANADFSDYIFRKGENAVDKVGKNMELKLEVSKTSCYVGQPVVATYKLYTRLKSESKLSQNPSFNGFSVIDMQQPGFTDYSKETVNGKEYNVYTIRKAQLYPLQPGVINLESAELENEVRFVKEEYANQLINGTSLLDALSGTLFPPEAILTQKVLLRSLPLDVTVKPLPDHRPASFNGAVGSFEINASLQKPLFSTDEAGKLTVTITGNGNMQLLTAPDIQWPKGIEPFEPKFSDKLIKTAVPVSGARKFEYSFAANDSGHFILPAMHFSYFDPAIAVYKEIATDAIAFQVTKGTGHPLALVIPGKQPQQPSFINRIFYHRWWIIAFIGIVILMGLIVWLLKDRKKMEQEKVMIVAKTDNSAIDEMIDASAINQQNVFSETEKCLYRDDCFGFYSLLNTELKKYLSVKFSIEANSINSNSIVSVMDNKSIPNDIVLKLQEIMHDIEWQLYTPFERNEKMNSLYQEAHEIVQLINTQSLRPL